MKSSVNGGVEAAFKNASECKRWLAALPLTNAQFAQTKIVAQLNLLDGMDDIPALERLRIAEHLRETVDFIQGQSTRKYLNKPMPPGAAEFAAWQATTDLWLALRAAYQRCLDAALAGDTATQEWLPLITQRCLRYTTFLIIEQFRIYREVDGAMWRQLNQLFLVAEERGFAGKPVKDSLNRQLDASTCQAAYVHALLIAAANPYHLSARHLNVLDKWLDKWAARVPLSSERPIQPDLSILAIDVAGQAGPFTLDEGMSSGTLRYLHTARLAEGVRKRIKFLRKGGSPAELDLGEECVQPGCEAFLTEAYRQWCEPGSGRAAVRRSGVQQAVETVFGMAGAYICANGMKLFEQPSKHMDLSREALQDLQMFGHVRERQVALSPQQAGITLVEWNILDENALGFRLKRKNAENVRIVFNQIVALRPKDTNTFVLGSVKWLNFLADGSIVFGVGTLPGVLTPLAARQVKLAAEQDFVPAFRLSATPALQLPESLVLPRGWFKRGTRVETYDGSKMQTLVMSDVLEVGSDFERVSFTQG